MTRRALFVLALCFCVATSCSSGGTDTIAGEAFEDSDRSASTPFFVDAELIEDLEDLQLAIDIAHEDAVELCMLAAGQPYTRRSIEDLKAFEASYSMRFPTARRALNDLDEEVRPLDGANGPAIEDLDIADREKWLNDHQECFINESLAYVHPLADPESWYAEIAFDASTRASADPRVAEAVEQQDRCEREVFGATASETANKLATEANGVVSEVRRSEMDVDGAIVKLRKLADEEAAVESSAASCLAQRHTIEEAVFIEIMNEISEKDKQRAELWVLEFRAQIDSYRPILDELQN